MTPLLHTLLNVFALCLTVPWIFLFIGGDDTLAGWPLWLIYMIAASVAYACFVSWSMKYYWEKWK